MFQARRLLPAVLPLLLSATMALLCLRATGSTAGLFFGGVAFATLIVPPLTTRRQPFVAAMAALFGTSAVWLVVAMSDPGVTAGHWASATLVLAGYVIALAGMSAALQRLRLPFPLPAALTTLLFALWLSWPIWLSPHLAGRDALVGRLVVAHPLMAIDGAVSTGNTALGPPWTERPLMYNELSILSQDVAYSLPATVAWAVLLHAAIGAAGWTLARRSIDTAPLQPAGTSRTT
jgi:hypothetical protein